METEKPTILLLDDPINPDMSIHKMHQIAIKVGISHKTFNKMVKDLEQGYIDGSDFWKDLNTMVYEILDSKYTIQHIGE